MKALFALKAKRNVELALVLFDFEVKMIRVAQLSWVPVLTELAFGVRKT